MGGTQREDLGGQAFSMAGAYIFRLENGLIVEERAYPDMAGCGSSSRRANGLVTARATVDRVDRAANVGRVIRCEEGREGGHFLGCANRLHHSGPWRHDAFGPAFSSKLPASASARAAW